MMGAIVWLASVKTKKKQLTSGRTHKEKTVLRIKKRKEKTVHEKPI